MSTPPITPAPVTANARASTTPSPNQATSTKLAAMAATTHPSTTDSLTTGSSIMGACISHASTLHASVTGASIPSTPAPVPTMSQLTAYHPNLIADLRSALQWHLDAGVTMLAYFKEAGEEVERVLYALEVAVAGEESPRAAHLFPVIDTARAELTAFSASFHVSVPSLVNTHIRHIAHIDPASACTDARSFVAVMDRNARALYLTVTQRRRVVDRLADALGSTKSTWLWIRRRPEPLGYKSLPEINITNICALLSHTTAYLDTFYEAAMNTFRDTQKRMELVYFRYALEVALGLASA